MKHYDIIIIWAGGWPKLRVATDVGKTVAIIEEAELWGTCLNRGCIPSKMLIYPSDLVTHIREDHTDLFIDLPQQPSIDYTKLSEDTHNNIKKDSDSIEPFYDSIDKLTLYRWHARFIENKVIEVNTEIISADTIYIATWSVASIPKIQWLEWTPYMTSKQALENTKLPKKMIVIWGWYIAVELWHVYGAAGTDVHFLVRSGMIKAEDMDIRAVFEKDFSERYNVHFWVSPTKVEYKNNTFFVTVTCPNGNIEVMESDSLFVATWVRPMTDWLWLENTDIQLTKKWYIQVNDYLETNTPWVYALWDVIWEYLFRHSVNYQWEYLVKQHYLGAKKAPIDYPPMPHAIFTYPQIAGVWVTEDELIAIWQKQWLDYETSIHHYKDSAMGSAMRVKLWFVKLIADKKTGVLLWAHIIGEKSSDIIHMMIVLISAKKTVTFMIEDMIFIHPALSEVVRNAARSLIKKL